MTDDGEEEHLYLEFLPPFLHHFIRKPSLLSLEAIGAWKRSLELIIINTSPLEATKSSFLATFGAAKFFEMSTKNARKDPAWKYGVEHQVPAQGGKKGYKYIKCNFCSKVITGGVKIMKEHLGCTHKDVAPCDKVPPEVKEEILHYLKQFQENKFSSQRNFEESVGSGTYYSGDGSVNPSSSSRGVRGPMDWFMGSARDNEDGSLPNEKMTLASAKEHRNRVCLDIG
ncbi:hypothetical protein E3N88_41777 [Mikania micrantha]|uniref:BED-type domain-containing protein n=1 Tax=Mikania micrantha TaxID=192012 RepID=A0A5N6LLY0_9ASTR|nr:hypothetical protein E3N88_41777 [Mikania micrantha]